MHVNRRDIPALNQIEEIIEKANKLPSDDLKRLSQSDRKILMLSCDIFKNKENKNKLNRFEKQKSKLASLNSKVEKFGNESNSEELKSSNFLVRFFKFLGNQLGFRISSADLGMKIHNTHVEIMKQRKQILLDNLKEIESYLNKYNLSPQKKEHIQKIITGFTNIENNKQGIQYIANKDFFNEYRNTRTEIQTNIDFTVPALSFATLPAILNAPELLSKTFEEVKEKGGSIETFLTEAFSEEDKSFEACCKRISDFANTLPDI